MRANTIYRDYYGERIEGINAYGITFVHPPIFESVSLLGSILEGAPVLPTCDGGPIALHSRMQDELDASFSIEDANYCNLITFAELYANEHTLYFIEQVEFLEGSTDLDVFRQQDELIIASEQDHSTIGSNELDFMPYVGPLIDSKFEEEVLAEPQSKLNLVEQLTVVDNLIVVDVFGDIGSDRYNIRDDSCMVTNLYQDSVGSLEHLPLYIELPSEDFLCPKEFLLRAVDTMEQSTIIAEMYKDTYNASALTILGASALDRSSSCGWPFFFDQAINRETEQDLTCLDQEVIPFTCPEVNSKPVVNINFLWRALKIFIIHTFSTSQYDFTLPHFWDGSRLASWEEMLVSSQSTASDINEEDYMEKFVLDVETYRAESQIYFEEVNAHTPAHATFQDPHAECLGSKELSQFAIMIPEELVFGYCEAQQKLVSALDFESPFNSTISIFAKCDQIHNSQVSISDKLAQYMGSMGQGLSVRTDVPVAALAPSNSVFDFQATIARRILNINSLLVLPPPLSPVPIAAIAVYSYLLCCRRVLWVSVTTSAQAVKFHTSFLDSSTFIISALDNVSPISALQAGNLVFADAKWVDEKLHNYKNAFHEFAFVIFDTVQIGGEQNLLCRKIAKIMHASFPGQRMLILSSNPPLTPQVLRELCYDYNLEQILCKASTDPDVQQYTAMRSIVNVELSAPLRKLISHISNVGQQITTDLVVKKVFSEHDNWASITVEYIKSLIADANRRSTEMEYRAKAANRTIVFEMGKLLLLRDLSCKISNSGIALGANLILDRKNNPKLNSLIDPSLVEMINESLAEVEAGLYFEHPKLSVLREIVDSELANQTDNLVPKILIIVRHEVVSSGIVKFLCSNTPTTSVSSLNGERTSSLIKTAIGDFSCVVVQAQDLADFSEWSIFSLIVDYNQDAISSQPTVLEFGDSNKIKYVKLVTLDMSQRHYTPDSFINDWVSTIREYALSIGQKSAEQGVVAVKKITDRGGWPSWLFQTLNINKNVAATAPFSEAAKAYNPYLVIASEEFLQYQVLVRHLEKDQRIRLVEARLLDGEDLILDYRSCCVVLNSKDIDYSNTSGNLVMEKISLLSTLYDRIWIIIQFDSHVDKNFSAYVQYLYKLLCFACAKVTIRLSVSTKYLAKMLREICDRSALLAMEQGLVDQWDDRNWLDKHTSHDLISRCQFPAGMNIFVAGVLLSRMSVFHLLGSSLPKLKKEFHACLPDSLIEQFYEFAHHGEMALAEDIESNHETTSLTLQKLGNHYSRNPRPNASKTSLQHWISSKTRKSYDATASPQETRPYQPTRKRYLQEDDDLIVIQPTKKAISSSITQKEQKRTSNHTIDFIEQFRFKGDNLAHEPTNAYKSSVRQNEQPERSRTIRTPKRDSESKRSVAYKRIAVDATESTKRIKTNASSLYVNHTYAAPITPQPAKKVLPSRKSSPFTSSLSDTRARYPKPKSSSLSQGTAYLGYRADDPSPRSGFPFTYHKS